MRVTRENLDTCFPTTSQLDLSYLPPSPRLASETSSQAMIRRLKFLGTFFNDNTMSLTKKSQRNHDKRDVHSLSQLRKTETPSISYKDTQVSFFPKGQLNYLLRRKILTSVKFHK